MTSSPPLRREGPKISFRSLRSIPDFQAAVDLQMEVWGFGARDAIPWSQLLVVARNGGVVLGAFDGAAMVGFLFSHPGWDGHAPYLYSKMLGVRAPFRGSAVGRRLKRMQYRAARRHGYRRIVWTFDPLERGSALLNVGYLRVICRRYYMNFYGTGGIGGLHAGLPSDRLFAEWHLIGPFAPRGASRRRIAARPLPAEHARLVAFSADGREPVERHHVRFPALIAIPDGVQDLKRSDPSLAHHWRMALRRALTGALARGAIVADIVREDGDGGPRDHYLVTLASAARSGRRGAAVRRGRER